MYFVDLVFRWAHILAAIFAVGGLFFMRVALHPTVMQLDEATRKQVQQQVRARWAMVVHLSIAFLLISGLYNFAMLEVRYQLPKYYHALWGTKFLLALVIFYISESLVGRSARADRMRAKAGTWMSLNLTLAIVVVLISGVLRQADKKPKDETPPPVEAPIAAGWLPVAPSVLASAPASDYS